MNKVIAVVVTYNRLDCLKECIASLRNQTYKDFDILVVNNGSTDGTGDYLDCINDIKVIHQSNVGGAGGFYSGMKFGYDQGYEWVWMMDDDGVADEHQLEELMKNKSESDYLNALVVRIDDHSQFSFPPHNKNLTVDVIRKQPVVKGFCHPFNGTLYKRSLIDRIGFIKREMFIWGDEKEYTARAINAGYTPVTITSAIHYHPKEKAVKANAIPFISGSFSEVLLKPQNMSHYYYRNLGYIDATYRTILKSFKLVLMHTLYFLRKKDISELKKFYKYYFAGRRNDYE